MFFFFVCCSASESTRVPYLYAAPTINWWIISNKSTHSSEKSPIRSVFKLVLVKSLTSFSIISSVHLKNIFYRSSIAASISFNYHSTIIHSQSWEPSRAYCNLSYPLSVVPILTFLDQHGCTLQKFIWSVEFIIMDVNMDMDMDKDGAVLGFILATYPIP